jgi:hypothetical protein
LLHTHAGKIAGFDAAHDDPAAIFFSVTIVGSRNSCIAATNALAAESPRRMRGKA